MAVRYQDYYEILGLERGCTQKEVQAAYRKLARKYHPDVSKEPDAEERFKQIGEAYEVLKDPEKRERYDSLGNAWHTGDEFNVPSGWDVSGMGGVPGGAGGGFTGFGGGMSDFFESLFGGFGGAGTRTPTPRRGVDHRAEVTISLEDAYNGGRRSFDLETVTQGRNGALHRSRRSYDVTIPRGATDGTTLRLSGQGGKSRGGGVAGNLYLTLRLAPHPVFRVEGNDLHTDLDVPAWDAALGAKVPVPTLEGEVQMTLPQGTSTGRRLRLRGKGLPSRAGEPGDLFVTVRVTVPERLTDEQRDLFERLRRLG